MSERNAQNSSQTDTPQPRIYVACLAAYSEGSQQSVQWTDCPPNGHLHGRWIDADQEVEDIQAEVSAMLSRSPIPDAEEWAIHDYEGFEGVTIGEYTGIDNVAEIAAFVVERGRLGAKVLEHFCGDLEEAKAAFDEYAGEYRSLADFAQSLTEDTTTIPESLVNYIDYKAMARDMELNGDVFTVELSFEEVHVFWTQ